MLCKKGFWITLFALLVLGASGGYAYYNYVYQPSLAPVEPTITTTQVRSGDLIISVSGSGTLSPASEIDLGFETGGYLNEMLVQVGDHVHQHDVLARLETDDLALAVAEAEIKVREDQLDLADASEKATESELANAEASIQSAQTTLAIAQYTYNTALNSDLDAAVRADLLAFQWSAEQFERRENGSNVDPDKLEGAWIDRAEAEADLNDVQRQADMEQLGAWNQVDQAQNRVAQAQENLEILQDGPTVSTIMRAELNLDQATLALDDARADLEAAELRAPFDGTVVDVQAIPGEYVGTASVISLADLDELFLCFWVEESDMSGVAVGNRLEIVFEALPDDIFAGEVMRIDPALVTVDGTLAVQAWASVDTAVHPINLFDGMNAEVEVISAESRDTLIVPLQALRELGTDQYAVFVVQPDGEMLLRPVQVGLMDFVNAEILSGLELGEIVSTGVEEGAEASDEPANEQMPPGNPMMRMLGGG
ncbi:MAG: efflux RND transporter periplasmic adaptor subunit [Chloroflexi bacterium]|nr:efflux RND transporter periplasmic adaptor subunit [Chloroflexota bacterium]